MKGSKFQSHCEKLVASLSKKKRKEFDLLEDDTARVRFLLPVALEVDFEMSEFLSKDYDRAEELKVTGNKLFQLRNYTPAISIYNEAIVRCPQDNLKGKELYAIVVANRSAVLFEMKKFEKVLQDLAFLDQFGHHPNSEKLNVRRAKATQALMQAKKSKIIEIENGVMVNEDPEEFTWRSKNITYPALAGKLQVLSEPSLGRYVVAKEDFRAGEIVAVEKPYVSVLHNLNYRTNCAYCLISTEQSIACERCCEAIYCNSSCKEKANVYHQHECPILLTLYDTGASVNCYMALRMITQRTLGQLLSEEAYANEDRDVVIYKTEDYYNVTRMVMHTETRQSEELLHFTFMSSILLRLLQISGYFEKYAAQAGQILEPEIFVGSLLLKYLQILQYNAHEISELQNITMKDKEQGENYRTAHVGAGLYPTIALFNHSCDPTVVRYHIRNTMVLRSIKPIRAGDVVYENYGPFYTVNKRESRLASMQRHYCFQCACQACIEDWPLFGDFDNNILRVACDCGAAIPTSKDIPEPCVTCPVCKKNKNLLPVLTALIPLEKKTTMAEELFARGKYAEAGALYENLLGIYLKHLVPPFSDMVLLQKGLRVCLIQRGNKKYDYFNKMSSSMYNS